MKISIMNRCVFISALHFASLSFACDFPTGITFHGVEAEGHRIDTRFSGEQTGREITYEVPAQNYMGYISHITFDAVQCRLLGVWHDRYGNGKVELEFSAGGREFAGRYAAGLTGPMHLEWTGRQ